MASAPNLAAVKAWLAGDPTAPILWQLDDPYRNLTAAARIAFTIAMCASGAPAFDSVHQVVEHVPTGRRIPPPPPRQESP